MAGGIFMSRIVIFLICVAVFVGVSVITAVLVYKSQMRKKGIQRNDNQQ